MTDTAKPSADQVWAARLNGVMLAALGAFLPATCLFAGLRLLWIWASGGADRTTILESGASRDSLIALALVVPSLAVLRQGMRLLRDSYRRR
ncbi:hypothetical protein AS593_08400 [Caulobacter vibrioides]|nr:hypothetical protein AS593_08400 [Caulobacter vibrioides]